MATPLAQCIQNTDIPWLVDPVTGFVVGQVISGSFGGAQLGQPPVGVAIYPGGQGPLNSFPVQSSTAAAVNLAVGSITFLDCTAGSIVATFPTAIPAGQPGLVVVCRVDATPNNNAFVTFAVASGSGQTIAGSGPQLANGQSFTWAFNGNFWKIVGW